MSQLGNAASNWKKERRADLFPSDLPGQAGKRGEERGCVGGSVHLSQTLSACSRSDLLCVCKHVGECALLCSVCREALESLTDRPHRAPLPVASLTILEMLRGTRFQVLATHRLPPVRISHDHTPTTDDRLTTAPCERWERQRARQSRRSRGPPLLFLARGSQSSALAGCSSASHCCSCPDETRNQSSRGD